MEKYPRIVEEKKAGNKKEPSQQIYHGPVVAIS